jgi:hypothetical protein
MIGRTAIAGARLGPIYRVARATATIIPLVLLPASGWASVLAADQPVPANTTPAGLPLAPEADDATALAQPGADAPSEAALAAIADAIQDSEAIRRVLGGLILPGEPAAGRGDVAAATVTDRTDDAAQPGGDGRTGSAAPRRSLTLTIDIGDEAVGGLTLGQVLHSVIARSGGSAGPTAAKAPGDSAEDAADDEGGSDEPGFDLRQRLLNSHLLGLALESVIQVNPNDNSFSIFGLGRFEMATKPGDNVLTTPQSLNNAGTSSPGGPDPLEHMQRHGGDKVSVVGLVLDYLEGPTGLLTIIAAGALFLMWGTVRVAASRRRSMAPRGFR